MNNSTSDGENVAFESMRLMPKQILHALEDVSKIEFDGNLSHAENIVIGGMGGSIYSYHIISSLYPDKLTVPIVALNDYRTPLFVNKKTLFIASSYSGTTEEAIQTAEDAKKRETLMTGITVGDSLGDLLTSYDVPFYKIIPTYNPSGQPRMGIGYMIFGTIALLQKLGYLTLSNEEIISAVERLEEENAKLEAQARTISEKVDNSLLIYVAAEHLNGAAHVIRNQTNETAKAFAEYNLVPELNHHFMEGLTYPKDKNLTFIFYNSVLYSPRVQKRMALTAEVIEKQGAKIIEIDINAASQIEQLIKCLQFGSYLTYFLAKKNNVDPTKIPWVDYFKKQLAA